MKIAELGQKKLVGIRVVCAGDQYVHEIPKAAVQLKERLAEIKSLIYPLRLIGAYVAGDYSEEEDGYWVSVEVEDSNETAEAEIPQGMVSLVVPRQKYAVLKHKGPHDQVSGSYVKLHQWIEANGLERIPRAWHLEISEDWGHEVEGGITEIETYLYDTIK